MTTEQLILSLGVILMAARFFGWMLRLVGQPRVVGEMIAGIVLGPSLLGSYFPTAFNRVFPASSLPTLSALSQIGLLLFMFIVGLEVDLEKILRQRLSVVMISNCSVVVPLALGGAFSILVYRELAGGRVSLLLFALFIGTAMSVTAFPVLARLLKEQGLLGTELGSVAISCAAVDDVTAWVLLAILTATVHAAEDWAHLAETLLGLVIFAAVMLAAVRSALARVQKRYSGAAAKGAFFFLLILLMLAASWTTEHLGVHPLFGAFVAGLVVPKQGALAAKTSERIESVTLALLLPLFFAVTGLRTRIDLLHGGRLWIYTAAILLIAIAGKFLGTSFASRAMGFSWRTSLGLGALMNTRGLVELVVLNAGFELGILSPVLFTIMVLMALFTTLMTAPLLALLDIRATENQAASA